MCNSIQDKAPLVTFCLLTYNQERFVREAVLGALAQNYSPLEIILSDDASSDRTFDILRETMAGYNGPHIVKILRSEINLGLIGHVNKLFALAEGELLLLAAGDDVSSPERTQTIVSEWLKDRTIDALCSAYVKMAVDGRKLEVCAFQSFAPSLRWLVTKKTFWFGCSAAYTKRLFVRFGPISCNTTEDVALYRRALLLGGVRYVNQPLVRYRIGCGMSTKKIARRAKMLRRNEWRYLLAIQMLHDITKLKSTAFLVSASAWWCRNLEWRLFFQNVLTETGTGRLYAYLLFLFRYPGKALLRLGWLFRS